MGTQTLFVDEAGHAGINYLDYEQPFHVAAGIMVPDERAQELRTIVSGALGAARKDEAQKELKTAKLLGSRDGRIALEKALDGIRSVGALPFFHVMERKFSLVGKLVDVFLDPEHQGAVDWLPTHAIQLRRRLVEHLYDTLPEEPLKAFAEAYRKPSEEGFRRVLDLAVASFVPERDGLIVEGFLGARKAVLTILEHETYGDVHGEHSDWAALNLPALVGMTRMADRYAEFKGATYAVVHDRNVQFEKLFTYFLPAMARPGENGADSRLPDGTLFRGALTRMGGFSMGDSATDPLLQGADVVASTISRIGREVLQGFGPKSGFLGPLAQRTVTALMATDADENPLFGGAYAHSRIMAGMLMIAMGRRPEPGFVRPPVGRWNP